MPSAQLKSMRSFSYSHSTAHPHKACLLFWSIIFGLTIVAGHASSASPCGDADTDADGCRRRGCRRNNSAKGCYQQAPSVVACATHPGDCLSKKCNGTSCRLTFSSTHDGIIEKLSAASKFIAKNTTQHKETSVNGTSGNVTFEKHSKTTTQEVVIEGSFSLIWTKLFGFLSPKRPEKDTQKKTAEEMPSTKPRGRAKTTIEETRSAKSKSTDTKKADRSSMSRSSKKEDSVGKSRVGRHFIGKMMKNGTKIDASRHDPESESEVHSGDAHSDAMMERGTIHKTIGSNETVAPMDTIEPEGVKPIVRPRGEIKKEENSTDVGKTVEFQDTENLPEAVGSRSKEITERPSEATLKKFRRPEVSANTSDSRLDDDVHYQEPETKRELVKETMSNKTTKAAKATDETELEFEDEAVPSLPSTDKGSKTKENGSAIDYPFVQGEYHDARQHGGRHARRSKTELTELYKTDSMTVSTKSEDVATELKDSKELPSPLPEAEASIAGNDSWETDWHPASMPDVEPEIPEDDIGQESSMTETESEEPGDDISPTGKYASSERGWVIASTDASSDRSAVRHGFEKQSGRWQDLLYAHHGEREEDRTWAASPETDGGPIEEPMITDGSEPEKEIKKVLTERPIERKEGYGVAPSDEADDTVAIRETKFDPKGHGKQPGSEVMAMASLTAEVSKEKLRDDADYQLEEDGSSFTVATPEASTTTVTMPSHSQTGHEEISPGIGGEGDIDAPSSEPSLEIASPLIASREPSMEKQSTLAESEPQVAPDASDAPASQSGTDVPEGEDIKEAVDAPELQPVVGKPTPETVSREPSILPSPSVEKQSTIAESEPQVAPDASDAPASQSGSVVSEWEDIKEAVDAPELQPMVGKPTPETVSREPPITSYPSEAQHFTVIKSEPPVAAVDPKTEPSVITQSTEHAGTKEIIQEAPKPHAMIPFEEATIPEVAPMKQPSPASDSGKTDAKKVSSDLPLPETEPPKAVPVPPSNRTTDIVRQYDEGIGWTHEETPFASSPIEGISSSITKKKTPDLRPPSEIVDEPSTVITDLTKRTSKLPEGVDDKEGIGYIRDRDDKTLDFVRSREKLKGTSGGKDRRAVIIGTRNYTIVLSDGIFHVHSRYGYYTTKQQIESGNCHGINATDCRSSEGSGIVSSVAETVDRTSMPPSLGAEGHGIVASKKETKAIPGREGEGVIASSSSSKTSTSSDQKFKSVAIEESTFSTSTSSHSRTVQRPRPKIETIPKTPEDTPHPSLAEASHEGIGYIQTKKIERRRYSVDRFSKPAKRTTPRSISIGEDMFDVTSIEGSTSTPYVYPYMTDSKTRTSIKHRAIDVEKDLDLDDMDIKSHEETQSEILDIVRRGRWRVRLPIPRTISTGSKKDIATDDVRKDDAKIVESPHEGRHPKDKDVPDAKIVETPHEGRHPKDKDVPDATRPRTSSSKAKKHKVTTLDTVETASQRRTSVKSPVAGRYRSGRTKQTATMTGDVRSSDNPPKKFVETTHDEDSKDLKTSKRPPLEVVKHPPSTSRSSIESDRKTSRYRHHHSRHTGDHYGHIYKKGQIDDSHYTISARKRQQSQQVAKRWALRTTLPIHHRSPPYYHPYHDHCIVYRPIPCGDAKNELECEARGCCWRQQAFRFAHNGCFVPESRIPTLT